VLLLPNVTITLAPFSAPEPVRPPLSPAMASRPLATAVLLLLLEVRAVQTNLVVKDETSLGELLVLWHTQFLRRNPSLKARMEVRCCGVAWGTQEHGAELRSACYPWAPKRHTGRGSMRVGVSGPPVASAAAGGTCRLMLNMP
jgi:hypothetical protein